MLQSGLYDEGVHALHANRRGKPCRISGGLTGDVEEQDAVNCQERFFDLERGLLGACPTSDCRHHFDKDGARHHGSYFALQNLLHEYERFPMTRVVGQKGGDDN